MQLAGGVVNAARELRAQNPLAWQALIEGLEQQTMMAATAMISAPADALLLMQGRALMIRELHKALAVVHIDNPAKPQKGAP